MRNRKTLIAFAVIAGLTVERPAQASEAKFSDQLAGAIFHYQLTLASVHHFVDECRPELMTEDADADRAKAIAIMTASLHASGAPEEMAEEAPWAMSARLGQPDCDDDGLAKDAEWVAEVGWSAEVTEALRHLGLNVVAEPLSGERFAKIEVELTQLAGSAARVMECVAATAPLRMPMVYGDWQKAFTESSSKLASVGFPGSRLQSLHDNAAEKNVESFFGDTLLAQKADCKTDTGWQELVDDDYRPLFSERIDAILDGS